MSQRQGLSLELCLVYLTVRVRLASDNSEIHLPLHVPPCPASSFVNKNLSATYHLWVFFISSGRVKLDIANSISQLLA